MSDNNQALPNQNLRPEIAIQTDDGYFQIPNSRAYIKIEEGEEGRQQQGQEMIFQKEEYKENHNQNNKVAIQTNNDHFKIPNSCRPIKVEEEQKEQEIVYEKVEHEEKQGQKTETSFALIERMLTDDGLDPQTINEILGGLESSPNKFPKESSRDKNLRVRIEEEKEELYHNGGFFKKQEDDEIAAQEKALLEFEERKTLELVGQLVAGDMQIEEDCKHLIEWGNENAGYLKRFRPNKKKNSEEQCVICLSIIEDEKCFEIEACDHNFHRECLEEYIVGKIDEEKIPIKCPSCKDVLNEHDVKICVQKQEYLIYHKKYDDFSFKVYKDRHPNEFYKCPTPDCGLEFNLLGVKFECPQCKKTYCKECETEWHERMSCVDYQEQKGKQTDEAFEKFAQDMKYKSCPQCKAMISKIEGCNAMVCSRCQTPFCYTCGKRGDGHHCNHR